MKNRAVSWIILLSIIAILIYFSIREKEPKEKLTKKEKKIDKYWLADSELENADEKIALLSILKNTPKDSITLVMRDYLLNTENDSIPFEKVITGISEKYHISKHRIASIVFSYKYETLTKDDVENEVIDRMTEEDENARSQTNEIREE